MTPAHDPLSHNRPARAKEAGEADGDTARVTYRLIVPGEFSLRVRRRSGKCAADLPVAHFPEGERRPADELQELLDCTWSLSRKLLEATATNDTRQLP